MACMTYNIVMLISLNTQVKVNDWFKGNIYHIRITANTQNILSKQSGQGVSVLFNP